MLNKKICETSLIIWEIERKQRDISIFPIKYAKL